MLESGNFFTICLLCFGAGFITAWAILAAGVKRREVEQARENRRLMKHFRSKGKR
mgnify:FL=1|jgi:uncharacterized membrane protein YciS (DUF1049 family)